jgi:hypothetical protein
MSERPGDGHGFAAGFVADGEAEEELVGHGGAGDGEAGGGEEDARIISSFTAHRWLARSMIVSTAPSNHEVFWTFPIAFRPCTATGATDSGISLECN